MQSLDFLGFGRYSIDESGNIYNNYSGRPVRRSISANQQWKVNLKDNDGVYTSVLVSTLVAETYCIRPNEHCDLPVFKDGDRLNPSADNLMWRNRAFAHDYYKMFTMEPHMLRHDVDGFVCEQDGRVYYTLEDAAYEYGLARWHISQNLNQIIHSCWPTGHTFTYRFK